MKTFIACLFLAAAFAPSEAAPCVPGAVQSITLNTNYTLQWSAPLNPHQCSINYFIINVLDSEDGTQFQLQTSKVVYSYNFVTILDLCKQYTFDVRALTNESVLGPSSSIVDITSPLADLNLSLTSVNLTVTENEIYLDWNLFDQEVYRCVSYYRVVYWDETNSPNDTYVYGNNFTLKEEVPCMVYNFQVAAIIANPDIEGPVTEVLAKGYGKEPNVPNLVQQSTTSTSVTMTWKLQSYAQNHCVVSSLNVYTVGVPVAYSSLSFNVTDNILRPDITFTIPSLTPNSVYVSTVNVKNKYGASKNITSTYQTSDSVVSLDSEDELDKIL